MTLGVDACEGRNDTMVSGDDHREDWSRSGLTGCAAIEKKPNVIVSARTIACGDACTKLRV